VVFLYTFLLQKMKTGNSAVKFLFFSVACNSLYFQSEKETSVICVA